MFPHISRARDVYAEEGAVELLRAIWRYFRGRVSSTKREIQTTRLRRREGDIVEREVNGYQMVLDLSMGGICGSIALNGVYGEETTAAFTTVLEDLAETAEEILVLDIGANIGYYTLLEAQILGETATIHAFEPSPDNVDLLETNLARNDFEKRVTVHQASVGATPGTGELKLAASPNSHFMTEVNKPRRTSETVTVDIVTVDGIIDDAGPDPTTPVVVRMDVEGYEAHVFEGMSTLLAADRPAVVMVELHPTVGRSDIEGLLGDLEAGGFELVYSQDGAVTFDGITVEVADTVNVIARRE